MIRIVSDESFLKDEKEIIQWLFENGLDYFHLRKSDWAKEDYGTFVSNFSVNDQQKMVCHFPKKIMGCLIHHKSFQTLEENNGFHSCSNHSIEDVKRNLKNYENCFWSPVFDSISKSGYKGNQKICLDRFSEEDKKRIIALGGIEPSRFATVKEKGFSQIAIKGWFWNQPDYKKAWLEIKNTWQELEKKY
jgi:thiamine-phosphate pyrophosphorylase